MVKESPCIIIVCMLYSIQNNILNNWQRGLHKYKSFTEKALKFCRTLKWSPKNPRVLRKTVYETLL